MAAREQIQINGKQAYEATFPNAATEVLGINYHFEGSGSIDYVKLAHLNGASVLEDDFGVSGPGA